MTPDEEKFLEELTALCHKHKMYFSSNEAISTISLDAHEQNYKWFIDRYDCIYFSDKEELWR